MRIPVLSSLVARRPTRAELDAELREEFEHHLSLLSEEGVRAGLSEEEARAKAVEAFGDPERHASACRRVVLGVIDMKRALIIAWNCLLALAIGVTFVLAADAHRRSLDIQPSATSFRTTYLKSIWGQDSGLVKVQGAVERPGEYQTSVDHPVSLAQLIEMAGGAKPEARGIGVVRHAAMGEMYLPIENAFRHRDEVQLMPGPGWTVTLK